MKKGNKKYVYIIGGIFLTILLVLLYAYSIQQAVVSLPDPNAPGNYMDAKTLFTTNLNGISLSGETAYLGSITASNTKVLCGQTNGVTLSNSYTPSPLVLNSDVSGGCENYIFVQGTFPKGVLEVTCNLRAQSSNNQLSSSSCYVNGDSKLVEANNGGLPSYPGPVPTNSLTDKITINTSNTLVKIEAHPKSNPGGSGVSMVTIKFTPDTTNTITNTTTNTTQNNTLTNQYQPPVQILTGGNIITNTMNKPNYGLIFLIIVIGILIGLIIYEKTKRR